MKYTKRAMIEKSDRLWHGPKEEVAIFGSSRAMLHIVPQILSANAYNYGVRGAGMRETLFMAKKKIEHMHKGLIIINLDFNGFSDDWYDLGRHPFRGEYRLVAQDKKVYAEFPKGVLNYMDLLPGIRFYGDLRANIVDYFTMRSSKKSFFSNGAELFYECPDPKKWAYINEHAEKTKFVAAPDVQDVLDDIYKGKGEDVKIAWVVSPATRATCGKMEGSDTLMEFLHEQEKRHGVYSFSFIKDSDSFDRTCFYDHYHLNKKGAELFTRLMRSRLMNEKAIAPYLQ